MTTNTNPKCCKCRKRISLFEVWSRPTPTTVVCFDCRNTRDSRKGGK